MDSKQATFSELPNIPLENNTNNQDKNIDISRIEAFVTPEQVFSANVARKRRTLTKKQSSAKIRENTPCRVPLPDEDDENETMDKKQTQVPNGDKNRGENESVTSGDSFKVNDRASSIPRNILKILDKTEELTDITQNELKNIYNKTKKGLQAAANRGRELKKKITKEQTLRSKSAPHQYEDDQKPLITKEELINTKLDAEVKVIKPKRTSKSLRPEAQQFLRKRKQQKSTSNKIVEILDPNSKQVLRVQTTYKGNVGLRELFKIFRLYTIGELLKEYKLFKTDMKPECQKIRVLRNKCLNELLLIILFCGCGAFMFKFTEGTFENIYKCGVKRVKRDFIDLLWIRSHNMREEDWKSLARTRLRTFEEELHAAHEAGMTSYSGQKAWSFLNSIVYTLTVITTIGYGHIYPTTVTGRALTLVYALIGIPLFLIALTDFGKLFTRCIKFVWSFVRRLYYTGSCRKVRKTAQVQEIFKGAQMMYDIATFRRPSAIWDPEIPQTITTPIGEDTPTTPALSNFEIDDQFNLPISIAILILLLYIFMGAFIYTIWEGWNFFKSFYFVFISMSTIGFGDVVPSSPLCTIVSIVYLVFGLALMSMCINVVQEKLSDTFKTASAKLGATIGLKMAEEDGSIITVPPELLEMPAIHEGDTSKEEKSESSGNETQNEKSDVNKNSEIEDKKEAN